MSQLIRNSFSSYLLTDKEALQGAIFTITQKQVLQNQLAISCEEKIFLEFDPEHPLLFTQEEAFKRGQIELIQYLLATSETAEEELNAPTHQDM